MSEPERTITLSVQAPGVPAFAVTQSAPAPVPVEKGEESK